MRRTPKLNGMNETYATVDIISDIIENTAAPPNRAGIIYRHFG